MPCIFIIENNEYSVYTPLKDRQGFLSLKKKCEAFNLNYIKVENHDFLFLYEKWDEVLNACRDNKGPSVIEVLTHRYLEHCGPNNDDNLSYRSKKFLDYWEAIDIIKLYENYLLKDNKYSFDIESVKFTIKEHCAQLFKESELRHINLRK